MQTVAMTDARHAATVLGVMPSRIVSAAERLGIKPIILINSKPLYGDDDLERIKQHLAKGSKS